MMKVSEDSSPRAEQPMKNLFRRFQEWKRDPYRQRASWTDKAIVLLTVGIVILARMQWKEMDDSGKQTDKIIAADNLIEQHQKQLVLDNKQTLQDNREALKATLEENRKEVSSMLLENRTALKAQIAAAHDQTKAALQSALSIQQQTVIAERPWLSVEVVPDSDLIWVKGDQATISLKLSIKNLSKSLAKDIQVQGKIIPTSIAMIMDPKTSAEQARLCSNVQFVPFARVDLFPTDQPLEERISISSDAAAVDSQASTVPEAGSRRFVGLSVVGCVVYHSSFEMQPRHTYFAFRLVGTPLLSHEQKTMRLPNGMPMVFGYFELGMTAPKDKLQKFADLFARNDAE